MVPNLRWPFLDVSEREKSILASGETADYRSRNDYFSDVSVYEKVSTERWNGWVPFLEVKIFPDVSGPENVSSPMSKKAGSLFSKWTFLDI